MIIEFPNSVDLLGTLVGADSEPADARPQIPPFLNPTITIPRSFRDITFAGQDQDRSGTATLSVYTGPSGGGATQNLGNLQPGLWDLHWTLGTNKEGQTNSEKSCYILLGTARIAGLPLGFQGHNAIQGRLQVLLQDSHQMAIFTPPAQASERIWTYVSVTANKIL